MSNYQNILGKQIELNAREAFELIEQAISEGLQLQGTQFDNTRNIFGRNLCTSETTDLSYGSGLAANGLRVAAILNKNDIASNLQVLEQSVRQQIPMLIFVEYSSLQQLHQLSATGAMIWSASSTQEAVDFTVIGHRIAELALLPVIIGIDQDLTKSVQKVTIPDSTTLMGFLGNSDHKISSPTPSQEMIFGKKRRRVPNWFNPDVPVLIGAVKGKRDQTYETAAREQFFDTHLETLSEKVLLQFEKVFNRAYQSCSTSGIKKADYIILSSGLLKERALEAIQHKFKKRVGIVHLSRMYPFPKKDVINIVHKKKVITVFDQCGQHTSATPIFKEIASLQGNCEIYSAKYGDIPSIELMKAVIQNMLPGGEGKRQFWVDLPFSRQSSAYPKHQILNQAIQRDYPKTEEASITVKKEKEGQKEKKRNHGVPYATKQFNDQGPAYSRIARFYDDTAALYENDREILADPYKALSVMPSATASLAPVQSTRTHLPNFQPEHCTACGDCFVYCPHAAIPPLALDLESILQSGITKAASKGTPITQLTPMVKNLVKIGHKVIRNQQGQIKTVADILPPAFEELTLKMKLEGDALQKAKDDFHVLMEQVGDLQIAVTDDFFTQRDRIDKDSGELFTLAIDPNACTGCGLCASVCDVDALEMTPTEELNNKIQKRFELWEHLPDTDNHTILRMIEDEHYNSVAAPLLSKRFYYAMAGGSTTEENAAQKAMLHLVTASAESAIQSHFNAQIQSIEELLQQLSKHIQAQLSNALPKEDFHILLETLHESKEERVPFDAIIEKWSAKEHLSLVDKKSLERKTELLQGLKELKWAYTQGPTGNGRSRLGIVLDESLSSLAEFPWNNFMNPLLLNGKGSAEMAKGLIQGLIRHYLDNVKLLRRAALEVQDKYVPNMHDKEIANLSWKELTEKERASLPPILLISKRSSLNETGLTDLINMLNEDLPLKFILLDDGIPPYEKAIAQLIGNSSLIYPLLAQQKAFIARTSLSAPEHFYKSMQHTLHKAGPALCWIFAPNIQKHSIVNNHWPHLNGLAHSTRAFTHFMFDPARKGSTLSSKIELNNPAPEDAWNSTQLSYEMYGDTKELDYTMTWADWAFSLHQWKDHFQLLDEENENIKLLSDYILEDRGNREGIPVICRIGKEGRLQYYRVSEKVVDCTEACLSSWNLLLEMSGMRTEFPDKLKKVVEKEASMKYDEEINRMKTEYEDQIKSLEQEHLIKIKAQLKEKLMQLSKRRS